MIALTSKHIFSLTKYDYANRAAPLEDLQEVRGRGRICGQYFYFTNPKVASSAIAWAIEGEGESQEIDYNPALGKTPIMIVRDPVSRWLSGTQEFLSKFKIDDLEEKFFNDEIYDIGFDRHTAPQAWFLPYNLNWNELKIYTYTPSVLADLQALGVGHFHNKVIDYRNVTSGNDKKFIYPKLLEVYSDPDFQLRLKDFYRRDYELLQHAMDASPNPTPIIDMIS